MAAASDKASLEHLIESDALGLEILHPGGLTLTRELARLCGIWRGVRVLELACGTGESGCLLAGERGARVVGLDASAPLLRRARLKAERAELQVAWVRADAHALPFPADSFDAVISECALCHLDKPRVLREMLRVLRPGGAAGMHDLCWQPEAPPHLRTRLRDLEEEEPESACGWLDAFREAGFVHTVYYDRSAVMHDWMRETHAALGMRSYFRATARVLRRWGAAGLWRVLASERIFANPHLGYAILVGHKPSGGTVSPARDALR